MFCGIIGSLWLLLNANVKSKLFSLLANICLHGFISVVGMGDVSIDGSTFCTSCGHIWYIASEYFS